MSSGTGAAAALGNTRTACLALTNVRRSFCRALRMCEATWSERCLETIAQTPDPQRYAVGVPNYPDSLMEGKAGVLYTYVSIQRPDQSSFPGYDGAT
jgi:hypothetical protein